LNKKRDNVNKKYIDRIRGERRNELKGEERERGGTSGSPFLKFRTFLEKKNENIFFKKQFISRRAVESPIRAVPVSFWALFLLLLEGLVYYLTISIQENKQFRSRMN
jgi:hypothetical protein